MASNPYVNFFQRTNEQDLYENLTVESIRFYAHDMVYLPRKIINEDKILNEPVTQIYDRAIDVEMYIKNWESFEGDGQLLSKFGLEIRDSMSLILSHRSFNEFIKPITGRDRPFEGDCIYIPMLKTIYQMKFANETPNFYTLGKLNIWQLDCDLLEFSNERFETGREVIDRLNPEFGNYDDPNYNLNNYDKTSKNDTIETEADDILDFSEEDPFWKA